MHTNPSKRGENEPQVRQKNGQRSHLKRLHAGFIAFLRSLQGVALKVCDRDRQDLQVPHVCDIEQHEVCNGKEPQAISQIMVALK